MKKLILLLLIVVCATALAQTNSTISKYDIGTARNVLVRNIDDHHIVSHCTNGATHIFSTTETNFGATFSFSCNLGDLFSQHDDKYVVKDMRVHDGNCYFCGVIYYYPGEPLVDPDGHIIPTEPTSQGFIGTFKLDNLATGIGRLNLKFIPHTDSLTRMVVYNPGYYGISTLVAAIGTGWTERMRADTIPILAELTYTNSSNSWQYTVMTCRSLFPNERFQDICVTESLLHIVSSLAHLSLPHLQMSDNFMLHTAKRQGYYFQYLATPTLTTEDALHYLTALAFNGIPVCYVPSVPLRICALDNDSLCIAYTFPHNPHLGNQFSIFKINPGGHISHAEGITAWPAVIEDLAYSSTSRTLALLGKETSTHNDELVITQLDHSFLAPAIHLSWASGALQSLSSFNGTNIVLGGTSSSNRPHYITENTQTCFTSNANCLANELEDFVIRLETTPPQETPSEWKFVDARQPLVWGSALYYPSRIQLTRICTQ